KSVPTVGYPVANQRRCGATPARSFASLVEQAYGVAVRDVVKRWLLSAFVFAHTAEDPIKISSSQILERTVALKSWEHSAQRQISKLSQRNM
ncbi:MAG TPA: hypothetical protein VIJ25_00625, partial [Methylococcales bacterium]